MDSLLDNLISEVEEVVVNIVIINNGNVRMSGRNSEHNANSNIFESNAEESVEVNNLKSLNSLTNQNLTTIPLSRGG